jgi:gluconokinase
MVIVIMGVSGSGKTTVGKLLATALGWPFYDADDFHPAANIEKMRQGIPLMEADRVPWLAALHNLIDTMLLHDQQGVVACSALTRLDRQELLGGERGVRIVYLHGSYELIRQRLEARHGHFFHADLLASQFQTLEEPSGDVLQVNVDQTPQAIVDEIISRLELPSVISEAKATPPADGS